MIDRLFFLLISLLSLPLISYSYENSKQNFSECLKSLGQKAQQANISSKLIQYTLATTQWQQQMIQHDRRQPELMHTFSKYIQQRVTHQRIETGQQKLTSYHEQFKQLAQTKGIPPAILVALWGLESNYGDFMGNIQLLDALATLACDQRRSSFFTRQWIASLKIIDQTPLNAEDLTSSWAGAMGHFQFMPTTYRQYAVDASGNGFSDIWSQDANDAIASAANFLQALGWKANRWWGGEVILPADFNYQQINHHHTLAQWKAMGITPVSGDWLSNTPQTATLQLLLPAGAKGPAFLVTQNFDILLKWNRSRFFALSVGYLANRISGKPAWEKPLPDQPELTHTTIKQIQQTLNASGYESGPVDGMFGPATQKALQAFQKDHNLTPDGYPDTITIQYLNKHD